MTTGDLYINASPFPRLHPTATLNISANTLWSYQEFVGGYFGSADGGVGAIKQSGGNNFVQGSLELGYNATDTGTYTLSSGVLSTNPPFHEAVGLRGTGSFSQSGGTNYAYHLFIGEASGSNGDYTLSGGTLNSDGVFVGGQANNNVGGTGVLTVSGTGVLNNSNGTLDVFGTTGSALNLNGGFIETYKLRVLGPPSLFNWTTGTLNFTDDTIFASESNLPSMASSCAAFGSALSLGTSQTLSVTGAERIGFFAGPFFDDSFLLTVGSGGTNLVSGTLTIDSGSTDSSTLQLNGGTLSAADIANYGKFTINSGSLTTGDVTLNSTSTLGIGLGGTARESQYGALTASGQLALDGSLVVSLNSFTPSSGQSFDILDWGSLVGAFSSLQLPALTGGLVWDTSQLYTTGVLSVGLPGDFNFNGVVDGADYVVWRKGLGTIYTQNDYDVWRAHFGQSVGSGSGVGANTAVPEPATTVLLTLAATIFSSWRRWAP